MGPLYHLQNENNRLQVLKEGNRVLKKDGILFSVGLSKIILQHWLCRPTEKTMTF